MSPLDSAGLVSCVWIRCLLRWFLIATSLPTRARPRLSHGTVSRPAGYIVLSSTCPGMLTSVVIICLQKEQPCHPQWLGVGERARVGAIVRQVLGSPPLSTLVHGVSRGQPSLLVADCWLWQLHILTAPHTSSSPGSLLLSQLFFLFTSHVKTYTERLFVHPPSQDFLEQTEIQVNIIIRA